MLILISLQYLFSRYFSSDVALEQLSWLIKGCGISWHIELLNDLDLIHLSSLTFDEFNKFCPIIESGDESGILASRFSRCINKIKDGFQYPQYYNGLMGQLLLFCNNDSYELYDNHKIQMKYEETRRLVITGYEEFKDFGAHTLVNVIDSLREMSDIFYEVHGEDPWTIANLTTLNFKKEDYYEDKHGKTVQVKPLDYSKTSVMVSSEIHKCTVVNLYHHMPYLEKIDCSGRLASMFSEFESAFASVTSGFIIRTCIGMVIILVRLE